MTYERHEYYCMACRLTIKSSLGIASHRRGLTHQGNVAKARRAERPFGIVRK